MEMNNVKVKYDDKVIHLTSKQVSLLTEQENSFFRGALDFYKNGQKDLNEPIDISSAPYPNHFPFLLNMMNYAREIEELFAEKNYNEILELAEYLGVFNEDQKMDIIALRYSKNIEESIFERKKKISLMAIELLSFLEKRDRKKFPCSFEFYKKEETFSLRYQREILFTFELKDTTLKSVLNQFLDILFPRLLKMKMNYDYKNGPISDCYSLEISLK